MIFVGVICKEKDFELIEDVLLNTVKDVKLIYLNEENIKNFQNVKFDSIILNEELNIKKCNEKIIQKICNNLKYLLINTDKNINLNIFNGNMLNIITYGLNHKCTITPSSIKEEYIMLAIQREILDKYGRLIEIGEKKIINNKDLDIYGNALICIIEILYKKDIKN